MQRLLTPGRLRWLAGGLGAGALVLASVLTLRGLGFWSQLEPGRVRPVPPGDQEIAWIAPATSGETWERLVKAVRLLAERGKHFPGKGTPLLLDTDRAFLLLTADVPEIGLRLADSGTLWIRWYKLSGNKDLGHWIHTLQRRATPPLAIAGGETSDRALGFAESLVQCQDAWSGPAPLFLITTATAERYLPPGRPDLELQHEQWPRLMGVYPGRTFRFCFTNTRMVDSVLDFLHQNPKVWRQANKEGKTESPETPRPPFFLFTLTWLDDGYSKDLASIFQQRFARMIWQQFGKEAPVPSDEDFIHYSVGDFYHPNPREEMAVGLFLANQARRGDQPQLLVLPTGTARARRFLRTLASRAPKEVRNMVVANGDAISFNNVYRDRDLAWNIQELPVPLVFFSHRNPIDVEAGFGRRQQERVERSSTQDLLLFRDLFEAMALAAFAEGALLQDTNAILERLRRTVWIGDRVALSATSEAIPFFDIEGNRTAGTGEHIVWLRPLYEGSRVLPQADLSVWRVSGADSRTWQQFGEPLTLYYDRAADEGSVHEGR